LIPIYFQKLQAIGGQKIKFIGDLQICITAVEQPFWENKSNLTILSIETDSC